MENELADSVAFSALYIGSKPVISRGGVVFSFVVKFDEADNANAILGGCWKPDAPVEVGITPIRPVRNAEAQ